MLKLLTVFATTITLTASTPTTPELKRLPAGNYLAINPMTYKVAMEINCGPDFQNPVLVLPPRTQEELTLYQPDGKPATACFQEGWKRAK